MNRTRLTLAACVLLAPCAVALAQPGGDDAPATKPAPRERAKPTLKVGDAAPAVQIEKWVKGDPVTGFEKGRTYVVEFWATWCGPCVASMPHLTEIQKEYAGKLTVVGVTSKDPRNTLERVEKMVADKGATMGYTVAWDKDRDTYKAFMNAAGQQGIPTAFVVDAKGKIAYIGHPMELDLVLDEVVAGTWDYAEGPRKLEEMSKAQMEISREAERDPKAALAKLDDLKAKYPRAAKGMRSEEFQIRTLASDAGAKALGAQIVDDAVAKKDQGTLNEIAWFIVDPEGEVKAKDLDLAMRAAGEAARLTESKDPAILDTLARVHFLKGEVAKAVEVQQKAVDIAPKAMKEDLEETLKEYQKAAKSKT